MKTTTKLAWVAGWNIPGYLGETDPETFETREEAAEYLADALDRVADGFSAMLGETEDDDAWSDAIYQAEDAATALKAGEDYVTIPCAVGSRHDLGYAYWITEAETEAEDAGV